MRSLALLVVAGCGRFAFDPLTSGDGGIADDSDPGDGGVHARSVQHVEQSMTTNSVLIDIQPVDPTKTFVLCDFKTQDSAAANLPTCELVDAGRLLIQTGRTDPAIVVSAYIVELSGNVRVQRGTVNLTTLQQSIPLEPVSPTSAFTVVTRRTDYTFNNDDAAYQVTGHLGDGTSLRLDRSKTGTGSLDVAWQVVEIEGASVQAGVSQIPAGQTSVVTPLTAVDKASSFVLTTYSSLSNIECEYVTRSAITSPTSLLSQRQFGSGDVVTVDWYVVSIPGARIQAGAVGTLNQGAVSTPIESVDVTRSFPLLSFAGGLSGDNGMLDATMCKSVIATSTLLVMERGFAGSVNGVVEWSVVELPR